MVADIMITDRELSILGRQYAKAKRANDRVAMANVKAKIDKQMDLTVEDIALIKDR